MSSAASQDVQVTISGGVLELTIARPEKKNALTQAMYAALAEALHEADTNSAVRAILITGAGDAFCAGNDLQDFQRHGNAGSGTDDTAVLAFMSALAAARKPVVAAVNGVAVGIGATLLLHCELVYCADSAVLRLPFVTLGLCAEFASSLTLPLAAGYHLAAEKLLLGEPISASEALQMRMVNRVLPAAELLPFARAQAAKLAALPPDAIRTTKALMRRAWGAQIDAAIGVEYAEFTRLLRGAEAQEAFRAFFEKRKPDFSRFG